MLESSRPRVASAEYTIVLSVQRQSGDLWKTSMKFCHLKGCGHRCAESAWSFVIRAVSVMNTNGPRKRAAVTMSNEWFATPSRKRRRRTSAGGFLRTSGALAAVVVALTSRGSRVVDPAARVDDDHERHRERHREQQDRQRRRVAHVEVAEAVLVEEHRIEERRAFGIAEVVDGLVARL